MAFLHFLLVDGRIRIQEAQKHTDPRDPDPEKTLLLMMLNSFIEPVIHI
jgi:hypothetical protein